MRCRWLALALFPLLAQPLWAAPTEPAVVVRFASVQSMLEKAKVIAKAAGQEDAAAQFLGIVDAFNGPKGVEGFDLSRPLGVAVTLTENPTESPILLMLPVADEDAALGLLKRFKLEAEKNDDGSYVLSVPGLPFTVYFRFAQKYLVVSLQEAANVDPKRLPKVADFLALPQDATMSMTFHVDRVPESLVDLVLGQVEARIADEPSATAKPGEREGQIMAARGLKQLLQEGAELSLVQTVGEGTGEIAFEAAMSARPGTDLFKSIEALRRPAGDVAGRAGSGDADALRGGASFAVPALILKLVTDAADKGVAEMRLSKRPQDKLGLPLVEALLPTLKAGLIDVGGRAYAADGGVSGVLGLSVRGGKKVEAELKKLEKGLPAKDKAGFRFDVGTAAGLTLHELPLPAKDNPFGGGPVVIGTGDNLVVIAAGPKARENLKAFASAAPAARPTSGDLISFTLNGKAGMRMFGPTERDPVRAARLKKLAADPERADGAARARVYATGGKLRARFSVDAALIGLGIASDQKDEE